MYEFTCKVMIDGEEDVVKTFAYSVIEAIDNLVQMTHVEGCLFSLEMFLKKLGILKVTLSYLESYEMKLKMSH